MNKSISYIFIFLFFLSQLNAQGGSLGCGEVIVDQIPFTFDSTTVGGDSTIIAIGGVGDAEDIVFTLNVHEQITIDISLCHTETDYDAQMGLYTLDESCDGNNPVNAPGTCGYPNADQGGSSVDCFAEDAEACTEAAAPTGGAVPASFRPIIYEYNLSPLDGQDTTTYYILVDGYNGDTGNFRITIEHSIAPYIVSTELEQNNNWIDMTFNEFTYSYEHPWADPDTISEPLAINQGDLTIDFNQNSGNVTAVAINGITKTNGNPLEGGELTVRLSLNLTNEPASGIETIEISPINSNTIYDGGGTPMQNTSTSGIITLNQNQCFDQELTEADLPFKRVTDMSIANDNWDFFSFPGIPDDPEFIDNSQGGINSTDGNDLHIN